MRVDKGLLRKNQSGVFSENINSKKKKYLSSKYKRISLPKSSETANDSFSDPQKQRLNYPKKLVTGRLNMNSIRNKLSSFKEIILYKMDIFLISGEKLINLLLIHSFLLTAIE